jgi:modulator of drug activity B
MNVLIINGHQYWESSKGELNKSLVELAKKVLTQKGHSVKTTCVDDGYDPKEEVGKLMWADFIIFQTPVYWFSIPGGFKTYIDEVYTAGYRVMFTDDGRTSSDPDKKYGSGGLMQDRKYMLSTTWNAPLEAFEDENQIFEGRDVDDVFFYFHKAQQFVGMEHVPAFSCFDVLKNPNMEVDFQRYEDHLNTYL